MGEIRACAALAFAREGGKGRTRRSVVLERKRCVMRTIDVCGSLGKTAFGMEGKKSGFAGKAKPRLQKIKKGKERQSR